MLPAIKDNLDAIRTLCQKHRVRRLFLTGSSLDSSFDPSRSDIDFVVSFEPQERRGLDDVYFKLLEDLESLLARRVDLIEAHTVKNPYLIASINRHKELLYAA